MINTSTLTLTAGILKTALLTLGTTAAVAISGVGTTTGLSYVDGTLIRTFPTTSTLANSLFPVGKNGVYMPINLFPTNPSLLVQLKAEAFTTGTGTNINTAILETYSHYWKAENVSATPANLTSLIMKEGDANIVSGNSIVKSTTNGVLTYQTITPIITSTFATGTPNTLVSTVITNAEFMGSAYYSFGTACTVFATLAGPNNICTDATSQLFSTKAGTWASSNVGIATVDINTGNVKGLVAGTVTITFTDNSGVPCSGSTYTRIVTVVNCSSSPGGVANDLISWYKGDDGLTTTTWADKIGNNILTAGGAPTVSNTLNFNPVATFDGTADYFGNAISDGWLGTTNGTTYYYVATPTGAASSRVVYGRGTANSATTSQHGGRNNAATGLVFASGTINTTPTAATATGNWGTATVPLTNLSRGGFAGGEPANFYVNANGGSETAATSTTPTIAGLSPFYIGRTAGSATANNWQGNIAEVIAFNGKQTSADYNRVESYLALKYGLTLIQTSPGQNYTASDNSVIWDKTATDAAIFNNDIFGIGKDSKSGLDQRISESVNNDNIVTLSTINNFSAATLTTDPSRSSLGDFSFETIANNNGTNAWTTTGTSPGFQILNRQWKVQEVGTVGSVFIQIDVENTNFNVPNPLLGTDYYVITDPNGDGDYNDGTATLLINTGIGKWTTSVNFVNGSRFTVATGHVTVGLDTYLCSTGSKIQPLTGAAPLTIGVWTANAGNPSAVTVSTTTAAGLSTGVATADFNTAIPGVYYFNYTAAGTFGVIAITYSDCKTPGGVPSNLWLWVKADVGVNSTSNQVTSWTNQAVTAMTNQLTPPSVSNHITVLDNNLNFNPVVKFDATDSFVLQGNYTVVPPAPNTKGFVFAVAMPFAEKGGTLLNDNCCDDIYSMGPAGGIGIVYNDLKYQPDGAGGFGNSTVTTTLNEPAVIMVNYKVFGTNVGSVMSKNGLSAAVSTSGAGLADYTAAQGFQVGGRTFSGQNPRVFPGSIAEVAHYNGDALTATQVKQIQSYLALKYGITLDQSIPQDYLASDGAVVWDNTLVSTGFNKNIFGVGKDIMSTLDQRISHSANTGTILTVSTDADFSSANASHAGITTDKTFVTIADNGLSETSFAAITFSAITAFSPHFQNIDKIWQAQDHGAFGCLYYHFDIATLPASGVGKSWYLIVADDAAFTTNVEYKALFMRGNIATSGVDFNNNGADNFFTLAQFDSSSLATSPANATGNVGISTAGQDWKPVADNAYLEISASNLGVVITRISDPALITDAKEGMLIYDTTAGKFKVNTGGSWRELDNFSGLTTKFKCN